MIPTRLCKTTTEQNDKGVAPLIQVEYLEQVKNAVNAAPYGLHSSPELKTPCLLITINRDASNAFILPLSMNERKNLAELKKGEVVVGNFTKKASILFDKDGNINITSQEKLTATIEKDITINGNGDLTAKIKGKADIESDDDMTAKAPNININGSGTINITGGTVALGPATTIDSRVFLAHTHSGVTTGPGSTGPVN